MLPSEYAQTLLEMLFKFQVYFLQNYVSSVWCNVLFDTR